MPDATPKRSPDLVAGNDILSTTDTEQVSGARRAPNPGDEKQSHAERELDEEFDNSAEDLWEDMRAVTCKVLQYASDVLHSSQEHTDKHARTVDQEHVNPKGSETNGFDRSESEAGAQKSNPNNHSRFNEDDEEAA